MKEFYIVEDGTPIGAFSIDDLRYRLIEPVTLIWREGWQEWQTVKAASSQHPELEAVIGEAEQTSFQTADMLLGRVGCFIDQFLSHNEHRTESHFFFKWLKLRRERYLAASSYKQRAIGFFLSVAVLFFFASLCFGPSWGWFVAECWVMFMAASEFPYFYRMLKKLSDDVLRTTFSFIPYRVWNWLERFSRLVSAFGLAYFLGGVLTPVYVLYQVFRYTTASATPQLKQGEDMPQTPVL